MNNFADSILELLLSWVRGILSDIWHMFSGDGGSLFAWLGKHWLSLLCVLLIVGATVDLIVYILRWHPQRVWISTFNRIFHRATEEEITFNDGYLSGIESFELDSDPVISEYINSAPQLEQYDAGIQQAPDPASQEIPPIEEALPVRRRRSDRHERRSARKKLISIKLPSLEEDDTPYTNYPSPPVRAREAFHDAVYPSDNQQPWQQGTTSDNHANS